TPGNGGAQGIESRWHLAPAPYAPAQERSTASTGPSWTLQRLRARTLPPCTWQVARTAGGTVLAAQPARSAASGTPPPPGPPSPPRPLPRPQTALAAPALP
ncbi:hypothetical protein RA19_13420, partial [Leisingera sp. ANG-M1]